MKPTVLVTGGAGYIGSHTCKALSKAGFYPVVFDNLSSGHRWAVRWGPLEVGDITDRQQLDHVIENYRPAVVIHFAGHISVGESITDPGKYYRTNVLGSLTLLEAMRDWNIKKIIFSSTSAVYGMPTELPLNEQHPLNPINPYGYSKLVVENMMADFVKAYGLHGVILRYFNAAGADPEGELGECHDPETHLIPLAIGAALGKYPSLTVFGDDYPTPDGTCIRDYVHVSDIAEAHVLALLNSYDHHEIQVYNIGNSQGYSVTQIIAMVERITGKSVPFKTGMRRLGDASKLVSESYLIRENLGWKAANSNLENIIITASNWMQRSKTDL